MAAVADKIALECRQCRRRNYTTTKNRKTHADKLRLRKFCSSCRGHHEHQETKVK